MKDKKITKEEAFEELKECISSVMLITDVITFINRIEAIDVTTIKSDIDDVIDNYNLVDDIKDPEFVIRGDNEIYIDCINIDLDRLKSEIKEVLDRV